MTRLLEWRSRKELADVTNGFVLLVLAFVLWLGWFSGMMTATWMI